jgi:hypothetical protein
MAQEANGMKKMAPFMGPKGEMPDMDIMRAMGMEMKGVNFDKDNPVLQL